MFSDCDIKKANHELNLSKIQSLDFEFKINFLNEISPVIVFIDETKNKNPAFQRVYYDLRIQCTSWEAFGGVYSEKKPYTDKSIIALCEETDPNFDCVFTFKNFKTALEKNKHRILFYFLTEKTFCVPLVPQEVEKIIERLEQVEKSIIEKKIYDENQKRLKEQQQKQKHQEELEQYTKKIDNLRLERQKMKMETIV